MKYQICLEYQFPKRLELLGITCHQLSEVTAHPSTLAGLELAKYVLLGLVDNKSVEKLAKDFDNDVRYINGIVDFLKNNR